MSIHYRKTRNSEGTDDDAGPGVVIAVEIGCHWSTYVIQTRGDFLNDRLKLSGTGSWRLDGQRKNRTQTSLLLRADGTVEEFGYMADSRFSELRRTGQQSEWFYFTDIIPKIYECEEDCIRCSQGKCLPASEVLCKMLGYMKTRAHGQLREVAPGSLNHAGNDGDIHWVFTVPALARGKASAIMMDAAVKSGIAEDHVTVISEPECAISYYSQLPRGHLKVVGDRGKLGYVAAPGSDVMLVDLRDKCVSITMVEIDTDATMRIIHTSGRVPVSDVMLQNAFVCFLQDVFGKHIAEQFENDSETDYEKLQQDFKTLVLQAKSDEATSTDRFTVQLPQSLQALWKAANGGMSVYDIIFNRADLRDRAVLYQIHRLSMTRVMLLSYCQQESDGIIAFVKSHMKNTKVHGMVLSAVLVSGQVSASSCRTEDSFLEKYFTNERGIPVVTSTKCIDECIVHGAALYGHSSSILSTRVMDTTYGICFTMPFDEKTHNPEWKYEIGGKTWANYVFRKHVSRGESVTINTWTGRKRYNPGDRNLTKTALGVYSSSRPNPIHITEPECKMIGELEIEFPESSARDVEHDRRAVIIEMKVTPTELHIKATPIQLEKKERDDGTRKELRTSFTLQKLETLA